MNIDNKASNYGAQGNFYGSVSINVPAASARPRLRAPIADFVGRSAEIEQLVAALSSMGGGAATIRGLRGMGGIGKTELAIVAAQRREDSVKLCPILFKEPNVRVGMLISFCLTDIAMSC